jgi:glycosyltransferase involved in cell wall biosynthesis
MGCLLIEGRLRRHKYLFIHQNFPAQFKHLAPALADKGHEVIGLGSNRAIVNLPGVRYIRYQVKSGQELDQVAAATRDFYAKILRGETAAAMLTALKREGFVPDVIFAHPGWGEALFVKDIFPNVRFLVYAEYYYAVDGGDAFFDPEFSRPDPLALQRLRLRNTHLLHALAAADGMLSPTAFQRDRHPEHLRNRVKVIHDGIDTRLFCPDDSASVHLEKAGVTLRKGDELVVFASRQLEPHRGYHIFMRALPELLRSRPNARIIIVGGEGNSYSTAPPAGKTWKQLFRDEVSGQLDMERVHFVGKVPHKVLSQLMQVAAVYTYLTYPFVLSWSLMEAMSIGCLIVASRTAPVQEVITNGVNGLLVDFFDAHALATTISHALENRAELQHLGDAARKTIIDKYDLAQHCLPAMLDFVEI